jgi:hypothetical protein
VLVLAALAAAWWWASAPPAHLVVGPPYEIGPPPSAVERVRSPRDDIGIDATRTAFELPGYDDVVVQEEQQRAIATGVDGFMWIVDLATGHARHLLDVPLMPAGARAVPGDPDRILFCAARYGDRRDDPHQSPGVYELTIPAPEVHEVAIRVPLPPPPAPPRDGNQGTIFAGDALHEVALADLTDENSRPIAFCNDLDVSPDGRRIYFSEPFAYEGASMGPGAVPEAITLGRNGRLWRIDRARDTIALIAQGYTFLDGVLLELDGFGVEHAVLITETPKFRILRLHVARERAGEDEVMWDALPGMPDGLDRDALGRIWVGFVRMRTDLTTWVHAHPWVKPLLLRLPPALLPVPHDTGMLALSRNARTPLYFAAHDGSRVREISVVVPGKDRLYLPSFALDNRGLVTMPYPKPLTAPARVRAGAVTRP